MTDEHRTDPPPVPQPWTPGQAWPDPHAPSGETRWASPAGEYAPAADGASSWAALDPPGEVPPPVAGIDGPQTAPGWLTRGRDGDGAA